MMLQRLFCVAILLLSIGCKFPWQKEFTPGSLKIVPVVMEQQVVDLVKGSGEVVLRHDTVQIKFKIWAYDPQFPEGKGTLLEENPADHPLVIKLGARAVLAAWEDSIVGMHVGGKRLVLLPPSQAYGTQKSSLIPASTPLIIETEVLQKKVGN